MISINSATALEVIKIEPTYQIYNLRPFVEIHESNGDQIRLSTLLSDGLIRRMVVTATESTGRPNWAVFAIKSSHEKELNFSLVAPIYSSIYPGNAFRDIAKRRIFKVTPNLGPIPNKVESNIADVFTFNLKPGEIKTFVLELNGYALPELLLYETSVYARGIENRLSGDMLFGFLIFFSAIISSAILFYKKGIKAFLLIALLAAIAIRWQYSNLLIPATLVNADAIKYHIASSELAVLVGTILTYIFFNKNILPKKFSSHALIGYLFVGIFLSASIYIDPPLARSFAILLSFGIAILGLIHMLLARVAEGRNRYYFAALWMAFILLQALPNFLILFVESSPLSGYLISLVAHMMFFAAYVWVSTKRADHKKFDFGYARLAYISIITIGVTIICASFFGHTRTNAAIESQAVLNQVSMSTPPEVTPAYEAKPGEVILKYGPLNE